MLKYLQKYNLSYNSIPAKETTKSIIILIHGYGSSKEDLTPIASSMQKDFPNTTFIIPNAPFKCDTGSGFQWFPLHIDDNSVNIKSYSDIIKANLILKSFIEDKIIKKYNLDSKSIGIFGFSQGAVLALFNSFASKANYGAIVAHSGAFFLKKNLFHMNPNQNILLVHGRQDEVIPYIYFKQTMTYLDQEKINYLAFLKDNLGHHVDEKSINFTKQFFIKNLS